MGGAISKFYLVIYKLSIVMSSGIQWKKGRECKKNWFLVFEEFEKLVEQKVVSRKWHWKVTAASEIRLKRALKKTEEQ